MITWPWSWRRRALSAEAKAKVADALVDATNAELEEAQIRLDIVNRKNGALQRQVRTMSER